MLWSIFNYIGKNIIRKEHIMRKDKPKGIPLKKRKENFCSSLCDVEKFLNDLNKSLKYLSLFKHFK